ncbi:alpha/beta hydrolase family protein [Methylocystis parvus]|uniref:alpha/beta hydrolase family protein n=1 Tax=Methylocystis parvus TaxID=134 RepID=UPI003C755296
MSAQTRGVETTVVKVGDIHATIFKMLDHPPAPVIVIAHGFSGSQQLMAPMATTLAQNGYVAVTFDFSGHGRNPAPMTGGVRDLQQSTAVLLSDIEKVVAFARRLPGVDGRVAVAGHSMATDLIVRQARRDPSIAAVVAFSFFAQDVTPDSPRNLLIVDGAWESRRLIDVGLHVVSETAKAPAQPGVTYGDIAAGKGRRLALARGVEHIGVLYSEDALSETVAWLNDVFGRNEEGFVDRRGKWLALAFAGLIALARPLAGLLPVVSPAPLGASLPWRRLAPLALAPAVLTPLLLWKIPTDVMPILLGDYLALHLGLYGLLTASGLRLMGKQAELPSAPFAPLVIASLAVGAYYTLVFGVPLDAYVVSFFPTAQRALLIPPIFVGCALYFLADEWMTRGACVAPGGYAFSKFCFIASLGIAVALNPRRLFFLVIIAIVVIILLTVYGLVGRWVYARTRDPRPGALGAAFGLAWAIAVCFPIVG